MSQQRAHWTRKNDDRRRGRANGNEAQRKAAKALRKATGGAFGYEDAAYQEACLWGTTGKVGAKAGQKPKAKWEQQLNEVKS